LLHCIGKPDCWIHCQWPRLIHPQREKQMLVTQSCVSVTQSCLFPTAAGVIEEMVDFGVARMTGRIVATGPATHGQDRAIS
jgi:hypothetical protein